MSTTTTTVKPTPKVELKPSSTSTTTTTGKPTTKDDFPTLPTKKSDFTTTTGKPTTKDDFPTLPTKKSAFIPTPTPTGSSSNAWSVPLSPTPASNGNQPSKVSFITTPKSNLPAVTPSTTHRPANAPSSTRSPGSEKSLVSDEELSQVSETIFSKETNSKLANLHLDIQGRTKSFETKDEAPKPLFNPDDQALRSNSIIKMMALFNNYELDTTVNEHVTPMERSEENQFLDIVMVSGVMRQAMLFLQNKGLLSPDPAKHRELVKTIWFTMYSRGLGKIGSSAFEHVFLNEIKNGTVIGLHNWVYFLEQEKNGKLDYMGYIKKVDLGNKATILVSRFMYNGIMKPVNGMFVGTSPELELALYTLCFQLRPDQDCPITLGGQKVNIVTHTWKYRGNKLIGSAYPEI
ncbi:ENDOU family protein [Megaselia abdita]